MIETQEQLEGDRLEPGQEFHFACHPGLACFNTCCAHKRLPVLPYDLLRLRQSLGLPSQEVLERFLELDLDPVSGWPVLRLKLDEQGRCSLLGPQGCTVYAHRPAACRTYPLARAVAPGRDGAPPSELFLRQQTKGCLGWGEPRRQDIVSWVAEQELAPYQEANDALLGLFLHPRRAGQRLELAPPQIHAVIMALYNLDVFRQMLERPDFAQGLELDPARLEAARQADEELLLLGRDWLMARLFTAPAAGRGTQPQGQRPDKAQGRGKRKAKRR